MRIILTICLSLLLLSCSDYDTPSSMIEKCKNLKGLNEFVLNETTIEDIYKRFKEKDIVKTTWSMVPNIPSTKGDIRKIVHWEPITIEHYQGYYTNDVKLDFYKDTLVQIYHNSYQFKNDKIYSKLKKQFGKGIQVTQSHIDSIIGPFNLDMFNFKSDRLYKNEDIYMIVNKKETEFIILHKTKVKKLVSAIKDANEKYEETATSNTEKNDNPSNATHKRRYGEYTNPIDGTRTERYKGSLEQLRDLQMIDEYMRNNPDF